MPKIEELKSKYLKDTQQVSQKQRLGFFTIPPSATAGQTYFEQKTVKKDQYGKVQTENRNIYSGLTSSGSGKKAYFHFQPSIYAGDPYMDPGKVERQQKLEEIKKSQGKQTYKPAKTGATYSTKLSYEYICDKPRARQVKDVIDENGRVKTENRNISSTPQRKVELEKIKNYKHMPQPYEGHLLKKKKQMKEQLSLRKDEPFKLGAPLKEFFSTSRDMYSEEGLPPKKTKKQTIISQTQHDCEFKPTCCKKLDIFSYPEYRPGGIREKQKQIKTERGEKFKQTKQPNQYKPSPSISAMKVNIMRSYR